MGETGRAEQTTKFGIFEVDLRSGELRKSGSRIKLQEQPFKVLQALLERPGEVVTDLNCADGSGPTKTGDFDHAVNVAIQSPNCAGRPSESPISLKPCIDVVTFHFSGWEAPQGCRAAAGMESVARAPLETKLRIAGLVCLRPRHLVHSQRRKVARAFIVRWYQSSHSTGSTPTGKSFSRPAQAYFSDGMTDELITELSKVGAFRSFRGHLPCTRETVKLSRNSEQCRVP
jgi:hypothetical protein